MAMKLITSVTDLAQAEPFAYTEPSFLPPKDATNKLYQNMIKHKL